MTPESDNFTLSSSGAIEQSSCSGTPLSSTITSPEGTIKQICYTIYNVTHTHAELHSPSQHLRFVPQTQWAAVWLSLSCPWRLHRVRTHASAPTRSPPCPAPTCQGPRGTNSTRTHPRAGQPPSRRERWDCRIRLSDFIYQKAAIVHADLPTLTRNNT